MSHLLPTGAHRDPYDPRDILFASLLPPTVAIDLPRKFDLRKDQSAVFMQKYGSCVGGSARSAMEYYIWKEGGTRKTLSDRFLYGRAKEYDGWPSSEGTWPRIMLKVMFGIGAPTLDRWPIEPSPTHQDFIKLPPQDVREEAIINVMRGGFARVQNYEELKRAIYLFGPTLVTLTVYETYDTVGMDGMIQSKTHYDYNRGTHENIAVGWDDDTQRILLKNQWDVTWGDQGYAWLPLNYEPNSNFPLMDVWSINENINSMETSGAPVSLGYPVETSTPVITQRFGEHPENYAQFGLKGHNGLDFRTKDLKNHYIIAADDGEVILAANDGGYGLCIRIKHSWGMSLYGHNSQLLVGDTNPDGTPVKVTRGRRIAIPGATGNADGEHCHFGIRINGVKNPGFLDWVNPEPYLNKKGKDTMILVKAAGDPTVFVQTGDTIIGFVDMAAYNKFTEGREVAIVEMPASELAKFKKSAVVMKL